MRKLFRHATIVDGTERSPYCADVLVEGGTIAAIGRLGEIQSERVFECRDLILAPGFIDIHAHSDVHVLSNPVMGAKIAQGITTEFGGNCGIGVFPSVGDDSLAAEVLGSASFHHWPSFAAYKEAWYRSGSGVNMGFFQAHGPLRQMVLGSQSAQKANARQIDEMVGLLRQSLEEGVWGLSTGLYYEPCYSASTDELVALAQATADYGRLLAVHLRCEGNKVVESLDEMIAVARKSGVRLQISHLKAVGVHNQRLVDELLLRIDRATTEGLDMGFDQYPYLWGSTSLFSLLPPQYLAYDRLTLKRMLADRSERDQMRALMEEGQGWDSIVGLVGFDDITLLSLPTASHYEKMSLAKIAQMRSQDPYEALFDLLQDAEGATVMGDVTQSEESLTKIMSHQRMCFGSDALYSGATPHPRSYNAALHLIGRYVNETHTLSIEEAVARLTAQSAKRLALVGRGLIAEGYKADLVLFDQRRLDSSVAVGEGSQSPLDVVMVNGEVALERGCVVGTTSGRLLVPLTGYSG